MKANIKLSLSRLIPVALLALIFNVIKKMTGNLFFTTPAVAIAAMQTLADKLKVAIEDATNGGKNERQIRDALVVQVQDMLRVQADYVRQVSAGDAVKLGSSGFEMAAQPQPIETLEAPTNVRADATGKNGQLEVRYKSSRGAHSYQLLMATSDPAVNANWKQIAITTKVRYIVSGMESYKAVWFAVVAIGAKNESPLSKPAMGRAA